MHTQRRASIILGSSAGLSGSIDTWRWADGSVRVRVVGVRVG